MSNSFYDEIRNRQSSIKLRSYNYALVAGVGGIGSWVALDLALSGQVRNLYIIDPDSIECSNLNRTPFRITDIGFPKVDALKYLILERRSDVNVFTYRNKTTDFGIIESIKNQIKKTTSLIDFNSDNLTPNMLIVDCRDDIYEDLYEFNCKYYKVGYDGLSVTIDGNPRNTAVWGEANGYRFTPSFIAPSQMIASLVVTDALCIRYTPEPTEIDNVSNSNNFDVLGRLNCAFTFETQNIIHDLFSIEQRGNLKK
jgi:hypothetical protein